MKMLFFTLLILLGHFNPTSAAASDCVPDPDQGIDCPEQEEDAETCSAQCKQSACLEGTMWVEALQGCAVKGEEFCGLSGTAWNQSLQRCVSLDCLKPCGISARLKKGETITIFVAEDPCHCEDECANI